jgi:hypothetical protein
LIQFGFQNIIRMRRLALFLCCLAALLLFFCKKNLYIKPVRYVAYVGFNHLDNNPASNSDQIAIQALEMYLDRLNRNDSIGCVLKLRIFDCFFDENKIPVIYDSIAADPDIALVVDNSWGKHLKNAREKIVQHQIPVMALNADQNTLDYGNNAVFLDPNDPQALYMVRFIRQVLKAQRVGFILEPDYKLSERFARLLRENGLEFDTVATFMQSDYQTTTEIPENKRAEVAQQLRTRLANCRDTVLLVNAHTGFGNAVMDCLLENKLNGPKKIFGLPNSGAGGDARAEEISKKGHIIYRFENSNEALPRALYHDKKEIMARFQPGQLLNNQGLDANLRRCFDAMGLFKTALLQGFNDRATISAWFRGFAKRKIAVESELYEFDSVGILKHEPNFSEIRNGKNRSCAIQLNIDGDTIPNLRVGLDVIDINEIDVKNNTFDCNLLYWVIADSSEIKKESYIGFDNISSNEADKEEVGTKYDDNYVIKIYRVSGKFLADFESFDFPFDKHEIIIPISALSSSKEIKVSFDISRLQINDKKRVFKFNDWDTGDYYVTLDNQLANQFASVDKVNLDPDDPARYLEKYKNLNVRLQVSRRPWGAIILIILPFLMFCILPIFMLFFHKISFEEVGELIITSFLAAVAYSINLVQLSPTTDSMNRAYLFLLLTLAVNFLCFLFVTYVDKGAANGKSPRLKVGKIYVPYLILIAFLMLTYFIFR